MIEGETDRMGVREVGGTDREVLRGGTGIALSPCPLPQITGFLSSRDNSSLAQENSVCSKSLFAPSSSHHAALQARLHGICVFFLHWILSLCGHAHPGSLGLTTVPLTPSAVSPYLSLAWSQSKPLKPNFVCSIPHSEISLHGSRPLLDMFSDRMWAETKAKSPLPAQMGPFVSSQLLVP